MLVYVYHSVMFHVWEISIQIIILLHISHTVHAMASCILCISFYKSINNTTTSVHTRTCTLMCDKQVAGASVRKFEPIVSKRSC